MKAYERYAESMGVPVGERVSPSASTRRLVASGEMHKLLAAAGAGEPFTLQGEELMHVMNILLPHALGEAINAGWTWDELEAGKRALAASA